MVLLTGGKGIVGFVYGQIRERRRQAHAPLRRIAQPTSQMPILVTTGSAVLSLTVAALQETTALIRRMRQKPVADSYQQTAVP